MYLQKSLLVSAFAGMLVLTAAKLLVAGILVIPRLMPLVSLIFELMDYRRLE
jgi:hypothetical protein